VRSDLFRVVDVSVIKIVFREVWQNDCQWAGEAIPKCGDLSPARSSMEFQDKAERIEALTRREFLAFSLAGAVGQAIWPKAEMLTGVLCGAHHRPVDKPDDPPPWGTVCSECGGLGVMTCPECDGTASWTGASENVGLWQRESARACGRCAWCNEWAEVVCRQCEGTGVTAEVETCHYRPQTALDSGGSFSLDRKNSGWSNSSIGGFR
jgi:hypothetical protein